MTLPINLLFCCLIVVFNCNAFSSVCIKTNGNDTLCFTSTDSFLRCVCVKNSKKGKFGNLNFVNTLKLVQNLPTQQNLYKQTMAPLTEAHYFRHTLQVINLQKEYISFAYRIDTDGLDYIELILILVGLDGATYKIIAYMPQQEEDPVKIKISLPDGLTNKQVKNIEDIWLKLLSSKAVKKVFLQEDFNILIKKSKTKFNKLLIK